MQIKIELLSALSKGKPLLVVLMSTDKRISAIGRNACQAIEMLEPDQKARIKVFTHSWGFNKVSIIMEAKKLLRYVSVSILPYTKQSSVTFITVCVLPLGGSNY